MIGIMFMLAKRMIFSILMAVSLLGCVSEQISPRVNNSVTESSVIAPTTAWQGFSRSSDLWREIRNNFKLNQHENDPLVQSQLHWFKKHPKYVQRVAERAKPYLYHIAAEIKKRDLPGELIVIPMIETAYNPFVYSSAGAAGLWQIMPITATTLGLKRSWWYDGRRDIYASTDAALNYFSYLEKFFNGDWNLAIAAYHAGEGTVANAMKRNKRAGYNTDFWSLRLPEQTHLYLPRLLALAIILSDPDAYNVTLPVVKNVPYFAVVNVGSQLDLAHAAHLAKTSLEEMYLLNPGYSRWATDPDGPHRLLIPYASATQFAEKLAKLPKVQRMSWQRYKITRGDSLIYLAKKYDTTVPIIKTINHLKNNLIREGQILFIPMAKHSLPRNSKLLGLYRSPDSLTHKKIIMQPTKTVYTIKPGDSLWTIAQKHHVKVDHLRSWNKLKKSPLIKPGKNLVIWKKKKVKVSTDPWHRLTQAAAKPQTIHYKVKAGDNLSAIALRYHTTVKAIQQANHLNGSFLHLGQKLTIRTNTRANHHVTVVRNQPKAKRYYQVKAGDSLGVIAQHEHMKLVTLKRLNHLTSNFLRVGQRLRVA